MIPETVEVLKGLSLPFYPMRPATGPLISRKSIPRILEQQESKRYVYQPKLNGDRVTLGVTDRRVIACNRHGGWYAFQIQNAALFTKLKSGSVFDGEVWRGNFYPFECLALDGRSFRQNSTEERAIMAEQMCAYLKIRWMFAPPTKSWLLKLREHLPVYEGLVRKAADAGYTLLASETQTSLPWLKMKWA